MSEFIFFTIFIYLLSAPGLLVHQALKIKSNIFLTSVSVSYLLFSLIFIIANYFELSAIFFIWTLMCLCLVSTSFLIINFSKHSYKTTFNLIWKPIAIISLTSIIYQYFFGSFTEIPADLFTHLERYQKALSQLNENSLGRALSFGALFQQGSGVFYFLIALASYVSGISTQSLITIVDFSGRTLFLLAIYFFATEVFKHKHQTYKIAALTTFFVAIHMGVNVFSFIRYYSFAPSILNMIIYFSAISYFLCFVVPKESERPYTAIILIVLLTASAATIHVQEALFIAVMVTTIAGIACLFVFPSNSLQSIQNAINIKLLSTILILSFVVFCIVYVYSSNNLHRASNAHWRLWEFGQGTGLLPDITTLNLKFQFSRVITLWGFFVYLLFFIHWRRYKSNLFLLAGMLSPLFTILNPFFIDTFLRHYNSTTLWRLTYIIPIHFVAADLFVLYVYNLKNSALIKTFLSALSLFVMIFLLLPVQNTWRGIHYNRFPTLSESNHALSYQYSNDLLTYLDTLDHSYKVLTDPMTGYMISAMTIHTSKRRKFSRAGGYKRFTFSDYENKPLGEYNGYLIIVNRRKQEVSPVGEISTHWSAHEWKNIKHYYPDVLITHLQQNQNDFEKLWESNGISVYLIY